MERKKVIIFLHEIQHYRVPIFRIVSQYFDITLCTFKREQVNFYKKEPFSVIHLPIRKIGPFLIHKKNIHKLAKKFDVVIGLMNLRCLDIITLPINPFLRTKIIYWGIGVSASYTKVFDTDNNLDFFRFLIFNKASALIFYTEYPIQRYASRKIDIGKMFIANNTVKVLPIEKVAISQKKDILFIGSLYPQKGIMELLSAYLIAYEKNKKELNKLVIIGEGSEYEKIKNFINEHKLDNQIILEGAIYEQKKLKKYFLHSIVCVSPRQAGLSVLMSMGYSLCFITHKDAITGGEILNINHNETGLLYECKDELVNYLLEVHANPEKFINIGINAKEYYDAERKPSQMAKGIIDAINYVIK